jgi:hypothetical protein
MAIAYLAELVLVLIPGTAVAMIDALANWAHIPFAVVVLSLGWNVFAPSIRLLIGKRVVSDSEWTRISRYSYWGLLAVVLWVGVLITAYSPRWTWDRGTWIQLVVIVYGYFLPALVGLHWYSALRMLRAEQNPTFAQSLQPATVRCGKCNASASFDAPRCGVCGYVFGA